MANHLAIAVTQLSAQCVLMAASAQIEEADKASHTCDGERTKIPVIVDTDIGTDIDDAFALALLCRPAGSTAFEWRFSF